MTDANVLRRPPTIGLAAAAAISWTIIEIVFIVVVAIVVVVVIVIIIIVIIFDRATFLRFTAPSSLVLSVTESEHWVEDHWQ